MARSRLPPLPEKLGENSGELYKAINDESPLPCVLIGVAALEQALGSLLRAFLLKGSTSDGILDPTEGFLGPVFNRARLCYCLGLISERMRGNLQTLVEIRNIFAHSHVPVDFTDSDIAKKCAGLKTSVDDVKNPNVPIAPLTSPLEFRKLINHDMRVRFTITVLFAHTSLVWAAQRVVRREFDPGSGEAPLFPA